MDKILSARLDEAVVSQLHWLAQRLKTSKKNVLEKAIRHYAGEVEENESLDPFEKTCGAWKRRGKVEKEIGKIRQAFARSMTRHHS